MSFADDIQAFADKAKLAMSTNTNNIVESLCTQAVINSPSPSNPGPFAIGLLANQWYSAVGASPSAAVGSATNDMGLDSISRIQATLSSKPFFGQDNIVTFANNTDHAYYAEVLGWLPPRWSGAIGPYAMARTAVTQTIAKYT